MYSNNVQIAWEPDPCESESMYITRTGLCMQQNMYTCIYDCTIFVAIVAVATNVR